MLQVLVVPRKHCYATTARNIAVNLELVLMTCVGVIAMPKLSAARTQTLLGRSALSMCAVAVGGFAA